MIVAVAVVVVVMKWQCGGAGGSAVEMVLVVLVVMGWCWRGSCMVVVVEESTSLHSCYDFFSLHIKRHLKF